MNRVLGLAGPKGSGKSTISRWLQEQHGYVELSLADKLKAVAKQLFPVLTDEDLYGPSSSRERKFRPGEKSRCVTSLQAALSYLRLDPEGRDLLKELFDAKVDISGGGNRAPGVKDPRDVVQELSQAFDPYEETFSSPRTILQRLGTEWGRKVWDEVWLNAVRRTVASNLDKRYVIADVRFPNEASYLKANLGADIWWVEAGERIGARPKDTHASEPQRSDLIGFCKGAIDNTVDVADLPAQLATTFPG